MEKLPLESKKAKLIDYSFTIGLILKTFFACGEAVAGVLLLIFEPKDIQNLLLFLTSGELKEDSKDFISTQLLQLGQYITLSHQYMAAVYLLIHGTVKLLALILLWKKKLWAYPLSILVFVAFIIFQIREFFIGGNITMIILCLFDFTMIVLSWLEYQKLKKARQR